MFKTRHAVPGASPATLTPVDPDGASQPVLKVTEYNLTAIEERVVASVAELPEPLDDGKVRWLEMNGLGDLEALRALGEKFGLHPLALEDVWHLGQRPKVEAYGDCLFIVLQMIYRDQELRLCGEQVSFFLGKNFLITIQEEPDHDVFDAVRARLRTGSGRHLRQSGADYLNYALIDAIIDQFFPVLEVLGSSLEEIEDDLLEDPRASCIATIHEHRRTLTQLRRFVWPQRDVINALLHDDTGHIQDGTKVYLRDCYDHTIRTMDMIETYRDVATGLMELYLSAVGMRTNEIMRVLTVISSIFIPLTFVAGVYGMNFDFADGKKPFNMPELHHPWGYLACLLLMAAIAVGQLLFFRRKKWL
ncbi:MAG TPA: magnesium/cobalt transporter CorA [Chthoniobacteraceae bacterium]